MTSEFFTFNIGLKNNEEIIQQVQEQFNGIEYQIHGKGIDITVSLSDIASINKEDLLLQLKHKNTQQKVFVSVKDCIVFNDEKIEEYVLDKFAVVQEVQPQNVYIDFVNNEYTIVPEITGNVLKDNAKHKIIENIKSYNFDIDIETLNCYVTPEITQQDEVLQSTFSKYKEYENFVLTYSIGDKEKTIDIATIHQWLIPNYVDDVQTLDAVCPFLIDEQQLDNYILQLKEHYSFTNEDVFTTSTGKNIIYSNSSTKVWLDEETLKTDIMTRIMGNLSGTEVLPLKDNADIVNKTSRKIGNTYIELSIDEQHIWVYIDGELILDSDIVTGNLSKKHDTRKGVFNLTYKTKNVTLRGPGYASFVSYWMPFDGGIGLHDATWRDEFGGDIYKTNGSHGCVNLPYEVAKKIYENITKETPIVVW